MKIKVHNLNAPVEVSDSPELSDAYTRIIKQGGRIEYSHIPGLATKLQCLEIVADTNQGRSFSFQMPVENELEVLLRQFLKHELDNE